MYHARFVGEGERIRRQRLREHLLMVARLAADFAREARPGDGEFIRAARRAGLAHDLGKYRDAFQQRLHDAEAGRPAAAAPHAVFGAGALGTAAWDQALAVLGHHAGLHAASDFMNKVRPEDVDMGRELLLRARADGLRLAGREVPASSPGATDRLALELRERMLFSCLVDADRSDCMRFETGALPTGPALAAQALLDSLLAHISQKAGECPPGTVKDCRAAVLDACLASASLPGRLLTLAVPTGGGKTLSGMAFALRRAALRAGEVRRVIVVVPYLSIIEQNAAEYRAALGADAVLEHHSGDFACLRTVRRAHDPHAFSENEGDEAYVIASEDEDAHLGNDDGARTLARENWDAPVIVTTSVRFFETIFSNRPSDLRRLHNIARSVVVLDEVQTLPRHLLTPLLSIMEGLARDWGVHFVFSTATQPAFERPASAPSEDGRWEPGSLVPIVPPDLHERLVRDLRRVAEPVWPQKGETWSVARQAEAVLAEPRALCILNTKRQVRELYEQLRERVDGWLVHLSTRMCAAHRLTVIRRIKEHLRTTDEPCRVVSSQLVEAGVDLSFPAVLRALGPLDAIVQAAGRCDRDGLLTAALGAPAGRLTVFEPEDGASPYPGPTSITRAMLGREGMSLHSSAVMRRYFNELYQGDLDGPGIQGLRLKLDFPAVSEAFALIDDRTRSVLVPHGEGADIIARLARGEPPTRELMRLAGRHQVGLYPHEFRTAEGLGTIYPLDDAGRLWACRVSCYDPELGLDLRPPDAEEHIF
ncbi:CRISPR-associated HD domain protein [Desulfovibrio sp. X2]|uniref:CRISPR-associated endonuclease Cas3'' n=1 Tax=Desulfovibrio sp. X2 TaxID=941449 RepID=UPI000358BC34|nr:CRISPR-associated endonuclease Cas3'' [Desulfovibrio sp. X2]EPR43455.1 CRISPR-associated HD domain protein [Desulfovibrio sp. X2]